MLLASWLLGILFGFLTSWLFGFLASWFFGFLAFRFFVGFCGFWWLFGFGFSHPLHCTDPFETPVSATISLKLWLRSRSALTRLRQVAFWLSRLCGFWRLWLFASSAFTVPLWAFWPLHPFIGFWIWLPASSASPVPPYLNPHFFEHPGGEAPPQPPSYFLDFLQRLNCTPS